MLSPHGAFHYISEVRFSKFVTFHVIGRDPLSQNCVGRKNATFQLQWGSFPDWHQVKKKKVHYAKYQPDILHGLPLDFVIFVHSRANCDAVHSCVQAVAKNPNGSYIFFCNETIGMKGKAVSTQKYCSKWCRLFKCTHVYIAVVKLQKNHHLCPIALDRLLCVSCLKQQEGLNGSGGSRFHDPASS